jgi:hypothetical protein
MNLQAIQNAIRAGHILVGSHATTEAVADGLLLSEVWDGVLHSSAVVIEDYPTDSRGSSCLIYCEVAGLAEHVVIAFPSASAAQRLEYAELAFLVTCYRPGKVQHASKWTPDFKKRIGP